MTKEELKEYAFANHSRLKKQEVALGDLVRVLVGTFAGINGVVKGIMVSGNDFADPYYEVEMECEVPDEYKCRKTLLTPNNVIGGVSAYEFEVIGHRAPYNEPTAKEGEKKLSSGDKVIILSDPFKGIFGEVTGFIFDQGISFVKVNTEIGEKFIEPHSLKLITPTAQNCENPRLPKVDWQHYRRELAAKIAVAMITATQSFDVERVMAMTDGIIERLKNSKV